MIRRAEAKDVESIARIHVDAWKQAYSSFFNEEVFVTLGYEKRLIQWKRVFEDTSFSNVYVFDKGGDVIGFVASRPLSAEEKEVLEINAIYVDPSQQSEGNGRTLFQHTYDLARNNSFKKIVLWSLADSRSNEFYKKMGGYFFETKSMSIGDVAFDVYGYKWIL